MLVLESALVKNPHDCIGEALRTGEGKGLRQCVECKLEHIRLLNCNLRGVFLGRQMPHELRLQKANQFINDGLSMLADLMPQVREAKERVSRDPANKVFHVILNLEKPVNDLLQLVEDTVEKRDNFVRKNPQLAK